MELESKLARGTIHRIGTRVLEQYGSLSSRSSERHSGENNVLGGGDCPNVGCIQEVLVENNSSISLDGGGNHKFKILILKRELPIFSFPRPIHLLSINSFPRWDREA